jgi:hypothetical protein
MNDLETTHLIEELGGGRCRCGRVKRSGQTFCGGCYHALPLPARTALYRRVGEGYEEAYAAAVRILDSIDEGI